MLLPVVQYRRRVRVAFVINSLGAGGTERSTAVLLPYLRERGIDPVVICLLHRDEGDEQSVIDAGFDVRFVSSGRWVGRVRQVRRLLRDLRPDVVHTAIFEADVVGRLAAARLGIPVITSVVNTPYAAERRDDPNVVAWKLRLVREIDSWTGRWLTTRFHAVTPGVAADAERTLRIPTDKITVVERGRDPQALGRRTDARRRDVRDRMGWSGREVLLAVGRHEHQKGHVDLVDAVRLQRDRRPSLLAVIAGRRGNATVATEKAIRVAALEDRVLLVGHRDDVSDLMVGADVFVMPSLYEGTAGAAIEALALELPVVATDLDGTRGVLVDGENALLVPVGDPVALAGAVRRVLDEPDGARARAAAGRRTFDERFTLERSADAMAALYEDVVGRAGDARPTPQTRPGPA